MQFSYYKTANRTASCGAVMPFCRQLWCGLCDLVNTPTSRGTLVLGFFQSLGGIQLYHIVKGKNAFNSN